MDATPASSLARRLDRLLVGTRRRVLIAGAAAWVALAGGALLAAAWVVGGEGWPRTWILIGLSASVGAIAVLVVMQTLAVPLVRLRSRRDLVEAAEARGRHANLLVAAEESLRRPERWERGGAVGATLRRRLWDRAAARLAELSPSEVAPLPWRRRAVRAAALVAGSCAVAAVLSSGDLARGFGRLARPWQGPPPAPTAGIYGLPTAPFAVAGDTVGLRALDVARDDGSQTVCEIRRGTGLWQTVPAELDPEADSPLGRRWRAVVADVREDFAWRFRRGDLTSPSRRLEVRDRPLVAALAAEVTPPTYTGVPARRLENLPARLEVPVGSTVDLLARTNHEVLRARLVRAADDSLALDPGPGGVAGRLHLERTESFTLHLVDAWGLANVAPLRYELVAAPDRAPAVALSRLNDDGMLPLDGDLELLVEAADDYGVAVLELIWRLAARDEGRRGAVTGWQTLGLPLTGGEGGSEAELGGRLVWRALAAAGDDPPLQRRLGVRLDTAELELVPGDVLELAVVARDNRRPPPAGTARSRVLRLLVPSAGDVLARQAETTEEKQGELAEMRNRERELAADLERLSRELMKNPVPDWGRQQEMEEAVRRQQRLRQELDRVARELNRELDLLARSQLTSPEQLRRAEELAELLTLPTSEYLQDLLERLEAGEDRLQPDEVSRALHEAARRQLDMSRRLEAALQALDRIGQEQEFEGMTALLEQLMRQQQELADQSRRLAENERRQQDAEPGTEPGAERDPARDPAQADESERGDQGPDPSATPDADELARRQEALAEELAELQEQLARTLENMRERTGDDESEAAQQRRQELEEALEQLREQMERGDMEQAAEELAGLSPEDAARLQQQAVNDMGALYHVLLKTQQAMQMSMQMNQAVSLRQLAADLLAVSERQEEIATAVPSRLRDVRSLGLTRSQHRLQKAAGRVRSELAGLTEEAPTRIVKQLEKLDGVIEEMGRSVSALEQNRAAAARRHTRASLSLTNRAIIGLLTEAQAASGSGSGGGQSRPNSAEQLQEMVRQQAELNGATEELRRMLADRGMSQETRAGMERLGQEQAELARRLGELAEQNGSEGGEGGPGDGPDDRVPDRADGDRILGDLHRLARDMETVGQEIDAGLVGEETVARQARILGRMLDARNSVRRRDYSTRRESQTADRLYGAPEGGARRDPAEERARTRLLYQPLDRAPLEYRDLVRRYFAALDSLSGAPAAPPGGRDLP